MPLSLHSRFFTYTFSVRQIHTLQYLTHSLSLSPSFLFNLSGRETFVWPENIHYEIHARLNVNFL